MNLMDNLLHSRVKFISKEKQVTVMTGGSTAARHTGVRRVTDFSLRQYSVSGDFNRQGKPFNSTYRFYHDNYSVWHDREPIRKNHLTVGNDLCLYIFFKC